MIVSATCQGCGQEWHYDKPCGGLGRRKYCSRLCSNISRGRSRNGSRLVGGRTCHECGGTFNGAQSQAFCSRQCANRANAKRLVRDQVCKICGSRYKGASCPTQRRTCSVKCSAELKAMAAKERGRKQAERYAASDAAILKALARLEKRVEKLGQRVSTVLATLRPCTQCGNKCVCGLILKPGRKRCDACKWQAKRKRKNREKILRRMRQSATHVEEIDRRKVFERDDWTCYLCGQICLSRCRPNHPHGATLDHVVALANGGHHTLDNVRCACRSCNSRKQHSRELTLAARTRLQYADCQSGSAKEASY